ncbi:hypothetical protein ACFXO9_22175 [Nocardia tengchongensis]|uniref:hypothetical protein n=1 Tax=Nocardia tengchongensis TaxID=2055889 RepID=UPI00367C9685
MYVLRPITQLSRAILGGIAAATLIAGGLFVFYDSPATDQSPAIPLPPISAPLDPDAPGPAAPPQPPGTTAIPPSK